MWDRKELEEAHLDVINNNCTSYLVIASDKLSEKSNKLELNGSLQMSICSGLIGLKGSGKFLDKPQSNSRRESSIHVRCHHRTFIKSLTMDQLGEGKIRHLDVAKTGANNSATHVVTEIQYGADATFTFRKRFNKMEDRRAINGQLNVCGNKIVKMLIGSAQGEGKCDIALLDESNNETDIECQFEGDLKLPEDLIAPTTYEEAIKFASKFNHVLSRGMVKDVAPGNQPLGVPCLVTLYPLVMLPGAQDAPIIQKEIGDAIASVCVRLMEDYEDLEEEVQDLLSDSLGEKLSPFRKKLKLFQQRFASFREHLKIKLRDLHVKIRSGSEEIASLEQLLNCLNDEKFRFNSNRLGLWLKDKHEEMCMVKRFQDQLAAQIKDKPERVLLFLPDKKLREQLTTSTVRHAICFVLTSLDRPEPFLDEISRNTFDLDQQSSTTDGFSDPTYWCRDINAVEHIEQEMAAFTRFVNANIGDEGLAFAMIVLNESDEECTVGSSVFVYHNGILKKKNYLLPGEPHSVSIGWDDDSNQLVSFSTQGEILRYRITYQNDIFPASFIEDTFYLIPIQKILILWETKNLQLSITAECLYGSGPTHVFSILPDGSSNYTNNIL